MKPWVVLDRATPPGRGGELVLAQRDHEFSMRIGGVELMTSRLHVSEDVLGRLACARLGMIPKPAVLVGGLGMGFTLRAALNALPADATVEVVELVPQVIEWNRGPLAELARRPLDDPRVKITRGDVGKVIAASAAGAWDAIVMDVDNGPDALVDPKNDALYGDRGVKRALRALRPEGCFALWSAFDAPTMTRRLRRTGFIVAIEKVRAAGAKHQVWLARVPRVKT